MGKEEPEQRGNVVGGFVPWVAREAGMTGIQDFRTQEPGATWPKILTPWLLRKNFLPSGSRAA